MLLLRWALACTERDRKPSRRGLAALVARLSVDDAADISASDIILMLMSSVVPVAEGGWSPRDVVATGVVNPTRYQDLRCRLARRGLHSHDAFGHVGTFCGVEYDEMLMPWSA